MAAKDNDINIHVKTPGIEQTRDDLGRFKRSVGDIGDQVEKTNQQTQNSNDRVEKSTKKVAGGFDAISTIVKRLKSEVIGMISGWLGISAILKLLDLWIEKQKQILNQMNQMYERSISIRDIGQQLEFQTGTSGKQKEWTQAALELQKAGGLRDIQTAGSMMIAGDVAFGSQGGIKNPNIQSLLKQIAPFFGAAGIGAGEIAKVFDFSQTAGVGPNFSEWMMYLARLQSGFTASKSTDFGGFMEGLQKGATPYIASGGSLSEAISLFSGARAVTANEALAGTMLEQMTRLSSGAYEKPRKAIESSLGVNWQDLDQDQRSSALLQYVFSLPESSRSQVMSEKGFPPELISSVSRVVSPAGMATINATRDKVGGANPTLVASQIKAFKDSELGKQRASLAKEDEIKLAGATDVVGEFGRRLSEAKTEFNRRLVEGKDMPYLDRFEPSIMMLDDIIKELSKLSDLSPKQNAKRELILTAAENVRSALTGNSGIAGSIVAGLSLTSTIENRVMQIFSASEELQLKSKDVIINNNNNVYYQQTPPSAQPRSNGGTQWPTP